MRNRCTWTKLLVLMVGLLGGAATYAAGAESDHHHHASHEDGGWLALCSSVEQKPRPGMATIAATDLESPDVVWIAWMVAGAQRGDRVTGRFIAENVVDGAGNQITNHKITEVEYPVERETNGEIVWGNFNLSRPDNGFPVGDYRLDLGLRGERVTSCEFEIQR